MFGCGSSAQQGARRKINTVPSITISGILAHGEELSANGARYDDLQWYADGVAISGQSGSTYIVDRADGVIGPEITCVATSEYGSTTSNTLVYYPSQLSGIRAVYDFGRGVTLSGSYVTALADQSTAGHDLAAISSSFGPLLTLEDKEFGGQPTATFDGTDDYLHQSSFDMNGTLAALTFIMPFRLLTGVNGRFLVSYNNSSARWQQSTNGNCQSLAGGVATTQVFDRRLYPHIMEMSWDGANNSTYTDGVLGAGPTAATTTAVGTAAFAIGASSTAGAVPSNFKTPMLCVLNRALTADERADFQSYFDWRFPQQAVDTLTAGTFTRASEASYLTAEPTDGSSPFMAWAATNVRRIESGKLLIEGARTNILRDARDVTAAQDGWLNGTAVFISNSGSSPDGEVLADRCTGISGQYGQFNNGSVYVSGSTYVGSVWVRRPPGSGVGVGQSAHYIAPTGYGYQTPINETYSRMDYTASSATTAGTWIPWEGRGTYPPATSQAFDYLADLHQVEAGVFPSSVIRSSGGATTRAADVLTYAIGTYPDAFRTDGFAFTYTPIYSNEELSGDTFVAEHRLIGFINSTNVVRFVESGGGIKLQLVESSLSKNITGLLTWSRNQELTITVRPNAGTMTLSGFTSGDGEYAGTAFTFPTGTMGIGNTPSGGATTYCYGKFSNFEVPA